MPQTIDREFLLEIRLYSALLDTEQERLQGVALQEQNAHLSLALAAERKKRIGSSALGYQQKLTELSGVLEAQYGVVHEDQVNWETGEIGPPPDQVLPQDRRRPDGAAVVRAGGGRLPDASGTPGTKTPDAGGDGSTESPVD